MGADSTDRLLDGDCVDESVVVPLPPHMQPTLADPLPPHPSASEPPSGHHGPPPEPIPAPSASLEQAATRLAMVPGGGSSLPAAVLPPRAAPRAPPRRASEIWNPLNPAHTLAHAMPPPAWPGTRPSADLDAVRHSLGTMQVALAMSRLPGPLPAASRPLGAVKQPTPPEAIVAPPLVATAATPWLLRGVAIVLTIAASLAAVAGGSEWGRDRHE